MSLKQLEKLDHPIIFALTMFLIIVGMFGVFSWIFMALGWSGPLSVLKGGINSNSTQMGPAPQ